MGKTISGSYKNKIMKNFLSILKNPYRILARIILGRAHFLSDKVYLNIIYRACFRKPIKWEKPQTYNEKLQWLKLYDRNPLYTTLVDKYEAKKYVAERIGEEYVIPTLGIWEHFDEIDFDTLPNQFVLKCTHDSGGLVIVTDKAKLDNEMARKKIEASMKVNYYWNSREWPYKNVKPRIIAEKYMIDNNGDLKDFKFFCFNGKVHYLFIASDRNTPGEEVKFDYFDCEFNRLPMRQEAHPNSTYDIPKPENFELMIHLAEKLSSGMPQARMDFYDINGQIYFGEYTFFHHGGFVPFIPEKYDYEWGNKLLLPKA